MKTSIIEQLHSLVLQNPEKVVFYRQIDKESWAPVTNKEFWDDICHTALYLKKLGLQKGELACIMGHTKYEWNVFDKAILFIGGTSLSIDVRSSAQEFSYIINDAQPKILFTDRTDVDFPKIFRLELPEKTNDITNIQYETKDPDSEAVVMYTSGTTSKPKGISWTHRQLLSGALYLKSMLAEAEVNAPEMICWLPLNYAAGRTVLDHGYFLGMKLCFLENPQNLSAAIKLVKPTLLFVVPRILEKLYEKLTSRFYYRMIVNTPFLGSWFVRYLLGGKLKYFICGSAPIDPKLLHFFDQLGLPTIEIYGQTECSVLIAVNPPKNIIYGSAGKLFGDIEHKLNEQNELLIRSPFVLSKYFRQKQSILDSEGYYNTGDVVEVVDDYVYIKGRTKEIIKTSNGVRVSPAEVEKHYMQIPQIKQIIVVGNNRKYISALVYAKDQKDLLKIIEEHGQSLSKNKRIQKVYFLKNEINLDSGLYTNSMKLKRFEVEKYFSKEIASLY